MPLTALGRTFVGIALIGLGIEHFVFQQFVTGRAPDWPAGMPGKAVWTGTTGAFVVLAGVAVLARRFGRQAMLMLAFLVFVWALLRHLPIAAQDTLLAGTWTQTGKALALVGGALAVAGTLPLLQRATPSGWLQYANATTAFVRIGASCLGAFLVVGGLQHFKYTTFVATLIPAWIPGNHNWWVWFAGAALIAGGIGLLIPRTATMAGVLCGLMIFAWFWLVHVPRALVSVSDGIALFEALAFSGIALVVAGAGTEKQRRI